MSIDKVELTNITVFKELTLNMSPGINIIIGQNGTGKTHLLKMIYFVYNDRRYILEKSIYENIIIKVIISQMW